ncbi:zinc-ribbon domain-containing protein [bacterium]|nr:zinc-ribbon domain-containing protein [bacterium]
MHITCTDCGNVYTLADATVPRRRLRVRCPACGRGLHVDGTVRARFREPPRPDDRRGWAQRLARALVSDILVYHRERHDAALAEGRLLVEFASELGEAWEAYKFQLGDDDACARHFREAVNEILAGGEILLEPRDDER